MKNYFGSSNPKTLKSIFLLVDGVICLAYLLMALTIEYQISTKPVGESNTYSKLYVGYACLVFTQITSIVILFKIFTYLSDTSTWKVRIIVISIKVMQNLLNLSLIGFLVHSGVQSVLCYLAFSIISITLIYHFLGWVYLVDHRGEVVDDDSCVELRVALIETKEEEVSSDNKFSSKAEEHSNFKSFGVKDIEKNDDPDDIPLLDPNKDENKYEFGNLFKPSNKDEDENSEEDEFKFIRPKSNDFTKNKSHIFMRKRSGDMDTQEFENITIMAQRCENEEDHEFIMEGGRQSEEFADFEYSKTKK